MTPFKIQAMRFDAAETTNVPRSWAALDIKKRAAAIAVFMHSTDAIETARGAVNVLEGSKGIVAFYGAADLAYGSGEALNHLWWCTGVRVVCMSQQTAAC